MCKLYSGSVKAAIENFSNATDNLLHHFQANRSGSWLIACVVFGYLGRMADASREGIV